MHVFRARELAVTADRPFTMYADGDPIGELPVRVRALPGAITMLTPRTTAARLAVRRRQHAPDGGDPAGDRWPMLALKLALARAPARSRAAGRRHERAGKAADPAAAGRDQHARCPPAAGLRARLGHERQDDDGGMAAAILERAGTALVHNQAGANMAGGIATTLLRPPGPAGGSTASSACSRWTSCGSRPLAAELRPAGDPAREPVPRPARPLWRARDDRRQLGPGAPRGRAQAGPERRRPADRGPRARAHADALYFGVEDDSLALAGLAHAADAKHCRRCGAPYVFDAIYLGHLGHYHCPSCDRRRPEPLRARASEVRLEGRPGARASPCRRRRATPRCGSRYPGSTTSTTRSPRRRSRPRWRSRWRRSWRGLDATCAAFGRAETVTVAGRPGRRASCGSCS